MIITRTPFRITLGGGGTDLPSFYRKHGGFLLTSAIDKYMYVAINTPFIDNLLRVKYSKSETVPHADQLQHELAREALRYHHLNDTLEIISFADISAGTGMGSSSSYLIGLLKALSTYQRKTTSVKELAELACRIEIDILKKPIGKQDAYIAAYGGLLVMDISPKGEVTTHPARVSMPVIRDLEHNFLLYYSGVKRQTENILQDQNQAMLSDHHVQHQQVDESLCRIKDLGHQSLKALEEGRVSRFAELMDEHWRLKKSLSKKISISAVDEAYDAAKAHGALGGKLLGAGGGGFLLVYSEKNQDKITAEMKKRAFKPLDFRFDFEGSKTLLNLVDSRIEYQHLEDKGHYGFFEPA